MNFNLNLKFFLLLIFLSGVNYCYSQHTDSIKYVYNNQTIYRSGRYFIKGSEKLKFSDLRNEFSASDLGAASFMMANRYRKNSIILRVASAIAGIAAIATLTNNNSNTNHSTTYILLGVQFLFGFSGAHFNSLSQTNLDRALWLRNRDVLLK